MLGDAIRRPAPASPRTRALDVSGPAYTFALGDHVLNATATDVAGNTGSGSTTFTIIVTTRSLQNLVTRFSTKGPLAKDINHHLDEAAAAKNAKERDKKIDEVQKKIAKESGKAFTPEQARVLIALADALR